MLRQYRFILKRITPEIQTVTAIHRVTGQCYTVKVNGQYSSGNAIISGIAKLKETLNERI